MTEHDTYRLAKSRLRFSCMCDHSKASHVAEPGFYDVRPSRGACTVVGCPCSRYDQRSIR